MILKLVEFGHFFNIHKSIWYKYSVGEILLLLNHNLFERYSMPQDTNNATSSSINDRAAEALNDAKEALQTLGVKISDTTSKVTGEDGAIKRWAKRHPVLVHNAGFVATVAGTMFTIVFVAGLADGLARKVTGNNAPIILN